MVWTTLSVSVYTQRRITMTHNEPAPRPDLEFGDEWEIYEDFTTTPRLVEETSPVTAIDEEGIINGE
jgi:hypothetical protein